ncbi:MAG: DUF2283 domain-containing protein [Thiohalobacteraceae bacterium]
MIHATYWPEDDILEVHFCDKPIAREASRNWNVYKSHAEDDQLVEVAFLDAAKEGYFDPSADGEEGCLMADCDRTNSPLDRQTLDNATSRLDIHQWLEHSLQAPGMAR